MPLYNYKCDTCGQEVDLIRPAAERNEPAPCEGQRDNGAACDGILARHEAGETNARMGHRWMP